MLEMVFSRKVAVGAPFISRSSASLSSTGRQPVCFLLHEATPSISEFLYTQAVFPGWHAPWNRLSVVSFGCKSGTIGPF